MNEGNDPVRDRAEKQLEHWESIASLHRAKVAHAETNVKMLRQIIGSGKPKGLVKNEAEPIGLVTPRRPDCRDMTLKEAIAACLGAFGELQVQDLCSKIIECGWRGSKKAIKSSVCSLLSEDTRGKDSKYKRVKVGVYAVA